MPTSELYLEVGVLEGRTLDAAAAGNDRKMLVGCDSGDKYKVGPDDFPSHVRFIRGKWQDVIAQGFEKPIGCCFYDGLHDTEETASFMLCIGDHLADEAVLVLDDWDRKSVRDGAFRTERLSSGWRLLREMPEYTDGLTTAPHHFGYSFGVAVWGFRRG